MLRWHSQFVLDCYVLSIWQCRIDSVWLSWVLVDEWQNIYSAYIILSLFACYLIEPTPWWTMFWVRHIEADQPDNIYSLGQLQTRGLWDGRYQGLYMYVLQTGHWWFLVSFEGISANWPIEAADQVLVEWVSLCLRYSPAGVTQAIPPQHAMFHVQWVCAYQYLHKIDKGINPVILFLSSWQHSII